MEVGRLPAFSGEYGGNGSDQYIQVQQQRPFLDVEVIVFYFMLGLQIIEASNLSKACQSGFYGQPQFVQRFVLFYKMWSFRPGTDKRHLTM